MLEVGSFQVLHYSSSHLRHKVRYWRLESAENLIQCGSAIEVETVFCLRCFIESSNAHEIWNNAP